MLNEKCYGILGDEDLIFNPKELKKDLEYYLKNAIHDGATAFILGANGDFDEFAFKICKSLQKRYKSKQIIIKVVLNNIDIIKSPEKHSNLLKFYENEQLIFAYAESTTKEEQLFVTKQFIVNNSYKCFAFVDDNNIKYLNKLSIFPYTIINLYNCKQLTFKKDLIRNEPLSENDLKNIVLYD